MTSCGERSVGIHAKKILAFRPLRYRALYRFSETQGGGLFNGRRYLTGGLALTFREFCILVGGARAIGRLCARSCHGIITWGPESTAHCLSDTSGGVAIRAITAHPARLHPRPAEKERFHPPSPLSGHRLPDAPPIVINSFGGHY